MNQEQERAIDSSIDLLEATQYTNIDYFGDFTENQWLRASNDDPVGLAIASLGISGEVGESFAAWLNLVLAKDRTEERIKKVFRGDPNFDISLLVKELGDVVFYWARICKFFGLNPSEVLKANVEKLKSRRERGTLKGDGDNR